MEQVFTFRCETCLFDHFSCHEDLYLHSIKHLKDKLPAGCWICGQKICRADNFRRHLKKHGIYPFNQTPQIVTSPIDQNDQDQNREEESNINILPPSVQNDHRSIEGDAVGNMWAIAIDEQSKYKIPNSGVRHFLSELIPFFHETFTRTDVDTEELAGKMLKTVNSVTEQKKAVFNFPTYVRPLEIDGANKLIYFIKISATLKAIMKNRRLVDSIMANRLNRKLKYDSQLNKVFSDTSDGEYFMNQRTEILPITLFADDFNVSNANFRQQNHSIFAISMSVDDIGYDISKNAQEMDLVAIAYTDSLRDGGLELIMRAIFEDMNHLQMEAITVSYKNKTYHLLPRITSIAGDNKAKPLFTQFNMVKYINY